MHDASCILCWIAAAVLSLDHLYMCYDVINGIQDLESILMLLLSVSLVMS